MKYLKKEVAMLEHSDSAKKEALLGKLADLDTQIAEVSEITKIDQILEKIEDCPDDDVARITAILRLFSDRNVLNLNINLLHDLEFNLVRVREEVNDAIGYIRPHNEEPDLSGDCQKIWQILTTLTTVAREAKTGRPVFVARDKTLRELFPV